MSTNLNSIGAFSRSSRRASNFREILPALHATISADDQDGIDDREYGNVGYNRHSQQRDNRQPSVANEQSHLLYKSNSQNDNDAEDGCPLLRSKLHGKSWDRVECMNRQREENRSKQDKGEGEALLVKKIRRPDGTQAEVIIGQSTLPQTVFNASNGE